MIRRTLGSICIIAGVIILLISAILIYKNFVEEETAIRASADVLQLFEIEMDSIQATEHQTDNHETSHGIELMPKYKLYPKIEMPTVSIEGHDFIGIIAIPKLEIRLPIMSKWSYENLKIAPCRFSGSAYLDNLIICAHNYKGHFREIGSLDAGDKVILIDAVKNLFAYTVVDKEVLRPNELDSLKTGEWDLTLFTCTLGGTTRIVIRCNID